MTTKLMARLSPNTSYAHRLMLQIAFTAATPLLAISTFSITRPRDPPSSATYKATSQKRRWMMGLDATDAWRLLAEIKSTMEVGVSGHDNTGTVGWAGNKQGDDVPQAAEGRGVVPPHRPSRSSARRQPRLPGAQVSDKAHKPGPHGITQTFADALPTLLHKQVVHKPCRVHCRVPCGVPHGVLCEGPKDAVNRKQGAHFAPRRCAGGRTVEAQSVPSGDVGQVN